MDEDRGRADGGDSRKKDRQIAKRDRNGTFQRVEGNTKIGGLIGIDGLVCLSTKTI